MNSRLPLISLLRTHLQRSIDTREKVMTETILAFVQDNADCAERSKYSGHLTGSAWIIDPTHTQALLCHHKNLNKWLQLGGHADGDLNLLAVALREAREESGLLFFKVLSQEIYDVDIHLIPARAEQAEHWHYDIRFLLETDTHAPLIVSAESNALAWVPLEKIREYSEEESLLRMCRKVPSV